MTNKKEGGLPAVLDKMSGEITKALGSGGVTSERFIRAAKSTLNGSPTIANLERTSVLAAVMSAAQDGLVIDGKEAAIVPFKGKATYIPMVRGLLKKMRQHSRFGNISHGIIYLKEVEQKRFSYIKGDEEELIHDPIIFEERGEPIGAYAVITMKDGEKFRSVMRKKDIEKRLAVGFNSSQKKEWKEEFWIKTVIKDVYKIAPNSTDEEGYLEGMFGEEKTPEEPKIVNPVEPKNEPVTVTPAGDTIDGDGVVIKEADPKKPKRTKAAQAVLDQSSIPDAEIVNTEEEIPM